MNIYKIIKYYWHLFEFSSLIIITDRIIRKLFHPRLYKIFFTVYFNYYLFFRKIELYKNKMLNESYNRPSRSYKNNFKIELSGLISSAEKIINRQFSFLGTGLVYWGEQINWNLDIKSGHDFKIKFYELYLKDELMPAYGIDIKIPWELNRLHHLVTLSQAWHVTKNKIYIDEYFTILSDWNRKNLVGYGINWTNPMEVAIRAVNIIFSGMIIQETEKLNKSNKRLISTILYKHGLYIENNLEVGFKKGMLVKGNHYLANVCGLVLIGLYTKSSKSKKWLKSGMLALENEMEAMVTADGLFFEHSTSYHRLAVELFLYTYIELKKYGNECSEGFKNKLEKMINVISLLIEPNGMVPQLGDNDDGRFLILSEYSSWKKHDYRYLLAIGAVLFDRADLKWQSSNKIEPLFWLLGKNGIDRYDKLKSKQVKRQNTWLKDGGLVFIYGGEGSDYLLMKLSPLIKNAPSAHLNNDLLSVELWYNKEPIFIDTGTYCYTSDILLRNMFRGTAMHNTVQINGEEINELSSIDPFSIKNTANANVLQWKDGHDQVNLIAQHDGYSGFIHKRSIFYKKSSRKWEIRDQIINNNNRESEFISRFHTPLKIKNINRINDQEVTFILGSAKIKIVSDGSFSIKIDKSYYAESYGKKTQIQVIILASKSVNTNEFILFIN